MHDKIFNSTENYVFKFLFSVEKIQKTVDFLWVFKFIKNSLAQNSVPNKKM